MAFIEKTAFEAFLTNNSNDTLCNVAGLYQASGANADCSAGLLVVRNGKTPCEGYPAGVVNDNTWYMNAAGATDTADDVVYACNTYDNQLLPGTGSNRYFIGRATLGLGVPAGRYGNFTRINFDNESQYAFGEGNLTAALGQNTFLTIGAGGLLTPAAAAPTDVGAIYFKVERVTNFVEGNQDSFGKIIVTACKVSTAA